MSLPVAAHVTARVLLLAAYAARHAVSKHAILDSTVTFASIVNARDARTTSLAPAWRPSAEPMPQAQVPALVTMASDVLVSMTSAKPVIRTAKIVT